MDPSVEVINIKNVLTDSTSSDRMEMATRIATNSVNQESDCLIQSTIYIKTESQDDEREAPIIENTSYEMCLKDNVKFTMLKIKYEDMKDDGKQDPLDVDSEIKVEEYFPIDLNSEPRKKTERTEKNDHLLRTDTNDSLGSKPNEKHNQLLLRNEIHKIKKYVCTVCNKVFTLKGHLNVHLRIHTGEKPFKCDVCEKLFTRKSDMNRHTLIHSDEKPYTCDMCNRVFRRKSHLNDHMLFHRGEKPFSCNECSKSFTHKNSLTIHKRKHTEHNRNKTEQTEVQKNAHVLKTDTNDWHGSRSNQVRNQLLNEIHKNKKYVCNVCNRIFTLKSNLDVHLRIHTGEKPFKCDVCEKLFTRKSDMNRHMLVHSGEKPYTCDICKRDFSRKTHLNDHMLFHSGEKPFSCDECNKSFTHKNSLTIHKRLHAGDKPYACDLCDKAFMQKINLTQHRRFHTGDRPYCCDICSKSYSRQEGLNRHKRHHEN